MKWLKAKTVFLSAVLSLLTPLAHADTQFRVIVDASGSMVISDPDKLTSEALRLISNLAPEEKATLGIWLFGEAPRVLLPESVINKDTKTKLASYVDSYITQDLQTDLEAIIAKLLKTPDAGNLAPGFERHWILVTDGMVDISLDDAVNQASRNRILNQLTTQLEDNEIHLHTISMTGYTDKELLETLSVRTNAIHAEAAVPEDLLDTFDRIFTQASPSDELPLDGNSFFVDSSISEVTMVVFHENGIQPHVIKPDGSVLSLIKAKDVAVSTSDHYTLITVSKPNAGEWQIHNVDLERSSIRVITDLKAQVTPVAPILFQNELIYSTVGLFQRNAAIKDEKLLGLMDIQQTLYRHNGTQKEVIFSQPMTRSAHQFKQRLEGISEAGSYELVTVIDGKTFTRQRSQHFIAHPAIELKGRALNSDTVQFTATPANLKLNVFRSNVRLELSNSQSMETVEQMPLTGRGNWQIDLPAPPYQSFKLRARLVGVTDLGVRFDYWTPYWNFSRNGNDDVIVSEGDASPSVVLLPTKEPATVASVAPIIVPPALTIVDDVEEATEETMVEGTEEDMMEEDMAEEEGTSWLQWLLYIGLGVISLGILVGGALWVRLFIKNRKISQDLSEEDV
ncbi:VWA domain-containing protein [Marinomonas sp. C2222]|uniref:VWA domain-containing protein n=1 Tax=Marinomonas sargassi TaxID=2984494 RepID=A0ABT2YS01_9GAMM|nr:vWA domain-containing protein [Marinomonas sargassi]MCV2402655.1 VWA domain-containing protein [Marinomonas sargassi]